VRDRAAATNVMWIVYQHNRGFQISLYFLNREAGWSRMRLTVLTLTAGCVLPKIYVSLNSPACSCVFRNTAGVGAAPDIRHNLGAAKLRTQWIAPREGVLHISQQLIIAAR
jgi:hypothetical protein